ncbi:SAM-dependent methyltransferase [Halobacteriales archaeon SW_7_71_33]|nr:MAG: SAM-dependent methyltransferase [Halobacteriales archaeon SW_7_71_33]
MKGREWYQADEVAEEYENKRFSRGGQLIDRREKRAVLSALGPVEDQEVLEIACGTGRFTVMLAERGADVVGLDISKPMLQQGRRKAAAANSRVDWLRGDAARLPFPDDSFDTVLAMRFFHLADTPAAFLSELRRVSRDRVVFDTFNSGSTRSVYNWLLPMGSRLYSRAEVEGLLARSGHRLASVSWWEARVPGADGAEPAESVARTETTGPAPSGDTGEPADPNPETAADGGERGSEPDSDLDPEPEPETAD